jgi:hypothetical protein
MLPSHPVIHLSTHMSTRTFTNHIHYSPASVKTTLSAGKTSKMEQSENHNLFQVGTNRPQRHLQGRSCAVPGLHFSPANLGDYLGMRPVYRAPLWYQPGRPEGLGFRV